MPPKKKKGTVAALKVRNKVHKKNMRKVVPKMPKQDNQNTQPIKITIKTPEKKESSSAPPKNESVAKVSTPTPQVSKPIISSTPVAPTVSSVSTTAEVEPSFDWTKFGTNTANYIASGNAIRDAKNDPGKLITSLASAASLSSINPYVGMAAAAVSLGKYGYDSYNEYNKKKKKKAKEKTRKHIANVMDITNTNDLYRLQYMRRQEKLLRQGFNAFRAKNIRDELSKQRIIESEVAINRRNQIKDMYDKIMRFKKKIEKEKAKEDSKAVLEELNKKKVITQKELRTTTKRNEHAEAYNKKPDPMPLTASQQDVAMKLFDAYMARAPNYIQQETDYVIPSGSALARADEITKQRAVKNETTKWNSSDQALYESILRRPGNAEMLLTNMSTPVLFPQLWANKLEDQLAKKQWWSNIKSIGLTTASTLLQLLRVVPSNDTKLQALNTINDKINSLNISDRYKDLLTRGANIIAENVFDTNKKLVDESYAKLNNLKALADLVATEDVNRDYLVKKLEEINETTPELPKMELSQADKDYISSYIHTPWFQKNVLGKNQPKTDRQKAIINILTNDGNRWINAKNQDEAAIDLVRMSLGTAEAFGGISNEGKPNYLTKIEQKKIEENVKELPDTWQGILMKAGFGNKEEAMNAKRKLQDAGIRNYDDAINRKNQIEAYITSFGHDGKNINDIMNEMMFMPQQQFEKYVQDRIDQDKNERYKAAFDKGIDYIKAVADNIKELKDIQKERARNKRDLERAKDDNDVEARFLNLRDILFKDFDANEFKNGEDDFFANEAADRNRNQILKTFFVIKDNFGSPKEEVFKQWWETKGKKSAKNSKGKNIFSLEANRTQEDREEANRIGKDLVHEYITDVQNNIANSPITIAGQKMVPWLQNESEGIRDDIMNIRNKFTSDANTNFREFERFDAIRQGLIENALTEKNSQMRDMLSYIPDDDLKNFTIQGIKKLIKVANTENDPQKLKLAAQAIANKEKQDRKEIQDTYDIIKEGIPDGKKYPKEIPPMLLSNLKGKTMDYFYKIFDKDEKAGYKFAENAFNSIRNYYKEQTYVEMPEDKKVKYEESIMNGIMNKKDFLPEPGKEKWLGNVKNSRVRIGRNMDRRGNIITYISDPDVSPYRMIFNDKQPDLPIELDTNQMNLRGFKRQEPKIVPLFVGLPNFKTVVDEEYGTIDFVPNWEEVNKKHPNITKKQREAYLIENYIPVLDLDDPKQLTQSRTKQISQEPPNPQPPKKESSGLFGGIFSRKKDSNIDPAVYENTQAKIDNVSQDSPLVDQYDSA